MRAIFYQIIWLIVFGLLAVSAAEGECPTLLELPAARGVACLHCLQPEARAQAETLSDILAETCLKKVAINYIVDGSFGWDEAFLKTQIDKLTTGGRELYLIFYTDNGPWRRRWKRKLGPVAVNHIEPTTYRFLLLFDPTIRDSYRAVVDRVVPIMGYAGSLGAHLHLSTLEDNFDDLSFQEWFNLTGERVPPWLPVSYGRSPCRGCYPLNTATVPAGFYHEVHSDRRVRGLSWGIVTNDGDGHSNPDALRSAMISATAGYNIFILWTEKYQGVGKGGALIHPADRRYPIPTAKERAAIIQLLRRTK